MENIFNLTFTAVEEDKVLTALRAISLAAAAGFVVITLHTEKLCYAARESGLHCRYGTVF